ncbi:hypothetical protein JNUCC31_21195 [Paenibacillus sp. JNUCC31]|uniref:hypothetical protein n=1 Tax=Paenibacillus sp. JNUCC-31 TaxID=2777983 RepID=UPI001786CACA|nr:hypothetical protein [Paenibacillus sp. JNUCC-31]QOS77302.1 hypothetical protein JNUCC31_21195 [Paenibacillus sp. JNUCC-31]
MKYRWKMWMAAGLAAIFISTTNGHMAFADSNRIVEEPHAVISSTSTNQTKPCMQASHGLFMIGETADLLGIGLRDMKDQMELGKTLTQIAKERKGLSEEQLLEKLKPSLSQRLDKAAEEGCLTKEQAAAAKAGMDTKLKKVINTPLRELRREFVHHGSRRPMMDKGAIARFIGITPEQLHQQLQSGESLAEIAQAKGISETQLVDKLKEQLTGDLKRFVNQKGNAHHAPAPQDPVPGRSASTEVK